MPTTRELNTLGGARLNDRQVSELIGFSRGILADGRLDDTEIVALQAWLAATEGITQNPLIGLLLQRIEAVLSDLVITAEERADLFSTLTTFTGNDFEVGEALKPTSLPLCDPEPTVDFLGRTYCFTGTFTFGTRFACEGAVAQLGGYAGSLTKRTDYLVIGDYATDSWRQSSFGNKIEKAVQMRSDGVPIHIVAERHWRRHLPT